MISLVLPLPAQSADSPPTVIPLATEHYPPYEIDPQENGPPGFDVEVVNEAFSRMGYQTEVSFHSWTRVIQQAKKGTIAAIISCAYRPERAEYMIFSDPISTFTNGFFMRRNFDGPVPKSLIDVKGQRVASVEGYESLQALADLGIKTTGVPNAATGLRMLVAGRFDYFYIAKEPTEYFARESRVQDRIVFYPMTGKTFHLCFSKIWPNVKKLVSEFNNTLIQLKNEGIYDQIHARYKAMP